MTANVPPYMESSKKLLNPDSDSATADPIATSQSCGKANRKLADRPTLLTPLSTFFECSNNSRNRYKSRPCSLETGPVAQRLEQRIIIQTNCAKSQKDKHRLALILDVLEMRT